MASSANSNQQADEAGEEDYDSDDDSQAFKSSLNERLDQVKTAGSFATAGRCLNLPLPGLSVEGSGLIDLPLTAITAKSIINVCHQAPFGKGSETVVNESVRKTWELDPTNFAFQNPDWQTSVQRIACTAARELGYSKGASIRAELYKLLLYEEGAMFKAHQDTEKTDGMFGTLVISLPSEHKGGDIKASHHGETKTFTTATHSAYQYQYIAWFADVMHEVRPVISGYRLVVIYNLAQTSSGPMPSAAKLFGQRNGLTKVLAAWHRGVRKRNHSAPLFLAYKLDHEYTEASLNLNSLKGLDKTRVDCLIQGCRQNDVGIYLASCEKKESGGCFRHQQKHHKIEDVNLSSLQLKRMVALDGTLLAKNIALAENNFIQEKVFDRDPDKEDYEGYMGNSGPDATHFYHNSVVILVPFLSRRLWLQQEVIRGNVDINTWMQILCRHQGPEASANSRGDLHELWKLAFHSQAAGKPPLRWHRYGSDHFPALDAKWPVKAAVDLGIPDLFARSLRAIHSISHDTFVEIGRGLWNLKLDTEDFWPSICELLDQRESFHSTFKDTESFIVGFGRRIHAKVGLQQNVSNGEEERLRLVRSWTLSYLLKRLEVVPPASRKDGFSVSLLNSVYTSEGLAPHLIAVVKRQHDNFAMRIAFITHIQSVCDDVELADKGARPGLDHLIGVTCHRFAVECQQTGTKRDRSGAETSSMECLSNPEDVALLLAQLSNQGNWGPHDLLLNRLILNARTVHTFVFPSFFQPLLATLIQSLQEFSNRVPRYADLFQTVLENYRFRYIQPKPPGGDWACALEGCGRYCHDCNKLDEFLGDPTKEIERFKVDNYRRAHLHQQLDSTGHRHDTDRSTDPETLVVKKRQSSSHKAFTEWQARVVEGEKVLNAMDGDVLKELLGDQYTEMINLRRVEKTHNTPGVRQSIRESRGKRVEIIDLT